MKVFRLSFASVAANFDERTRLHCETDTVQHEPSSFLGYAEGAGKLTGTYALLAVNDDPHGRQPVLNPESGILKDGVHLRIELPLAVSGLALPLTLTRQPRHIFSPASGQITPFGQSFDIVS